MTELQNFFFLGAISVISVLSFFLTFHRGYQDGLVGRAAFFITFCAGVVIVISAKRNITEYLPPIESICFLVGIAVFYLRFVARFLAWWWTGKGAWMTRHEMRGGKQRQSHGEEQGVH